MADEAFEDVATVYDEMGGGSGGTGCVELSG
jgi:hypothetical protein